jgi:sugar O-acyltransferase (sialic acid O-acetyltransferase NeuD family)
MKQLVIFGSAEIAELAYYYFSHDSDYRVVAFTVDDAYVNSTKLCGLPVIPFSQIQERYPPSENAMHVALSYSKLNQLRQAKYQQAKSLGYVLASYVCSKSVSWPDLCIGDNCFILENQTIQPTVKIGNNVMIWSGNHIGHGSIIGDHTYIASHVVISGHCRIGQRCFLGVNATLRDFSTIEDDCFITMDASITKDILTMGSVALGNPSTILDNTNEKAQAIKTRYFKFDKVNSA